MDFNSISQALGKHYSAAFDLHGPSSQGVDWGTNQSAADVRNYNMLNVIEDKSSSATLLDVGCGYGALGSLISAEDLPIQYNGIDIAENMINYAKNHLHSASNFYCEDFLTWSAPMHYDYVVCNGILTQKLKASSLEMNYFSKQLIRKMFNISAKGIAFNCMTSQVNFQKENLFYKSPVELLGWCMEEITTRVRLDNSYSLWYEYTIYLYKKNYDA